MLWIIFIPIILLLILILISFINKHRFVSLFKQGNTLVSGLRGRGKDVAFCVVINARKKNYISNINYSSPKAKFQRFEFDEKVWELAGNGNFDFVDNKLKPYKYPYPDGLDYYISDAAVYFPSQYQNELVKRYRGAPLFQALSRHLGDCNIHCNTQVQNRLWDKIREQSDIYIVMRHCWFIPKTKFCHISAYVYTLEESAEKQIRLPKFPLGKVGKEQRIQFEIAHGQIKRIGFFTRLPFNYDSRRYKKILENGCVDYEEQ